MRTRRGRPTRSARLVADLADPEVAYVCGRLRLEDADGSNREGLYWRYELWLREQESRLGSVTGGNGSIYALRREDYVEVDPRWGHDLALPYRMVQRGRRAVYEPDALAFERPTPTNETEYARKVRMFEHCWEITLRGSMLRGLPPGYLVSMLSHRVLRYGSGLSAPGAPRDEPRPPRRRVALCPRPPRSARRPRRLRGARAGRSLLRLRHVGDRAGPLELPPPRRAGRLGSRRDAVNRAADIALAGIGLVVASPLLGAAALAIKLEDRGPVLYRQTRVGRDGRDFEVLKLRSMVVGAERQGAGFAVDRGDSRITRVGRILRRMSLDELPQLWNVVRGDMSVIGPRPTLRYQVERYDERQRKRLDVRPGLTGWAQVNGRATLPWADRIELDVWYVENRSALVDLKILLRTPLALFGGTYKGASGGWR